MTEGNRNEQYPVVTLHRFLEEASDEFKRSRFQATVNLVASGLLLVLLGRFSILAFTFENVPHPGPGTGMRGFFVFDVALLAAAVAAVLWSLNVWRRQRRFASRWGERFEKLRAIEDRLLPEDQT